MALDFYYICVLVALRYLQHVRYLQHENGTFLYAIYNHASFLLEAPQSSRLRGSLVYVVLPVPGSMLILILLILNMLPVPYGTGNAFINFYFSFFISTMQLKLKERTANTSATRKSTLLHCPSQYFNIYNFIFAMRLRTSYIRQLK